MTVNKILEDSKKASLELANADTSKKNDFLKILAEMLRENKTEILFQNSRDTKVAKKEKSVSFIDRLILSQKRIFKIADSLDEIAKMPDPIGKVVEERKLKNGIHLKKMQVPIGVIGLIFEARPNVAIDASAVAIKSGNSIILKGGSDAEYSNKALVGFVRKSLAKAGLPENAAILLENDKKILEGILKIKGGMDVVIPRGGKQLINFVSEHSRVPIIETGASVVHVFVDESANLEKAVSIIDNSKTRRVSICNALDTLLVHEKIAKDLLPRLAEHFKDRVELRCDKKSYEILKEDFEVKEATDEDFDTEFLDSIMSIKVVKSLDEALEHIRNHSLQHTESIISEDGGSIERFLKEVDSACVFANISTQFSDGGEFGLGAEIGISTQKLHTRGPFALEGLTSKKWVLQGNGQTRSI